MSLLDALLGIKKVFFGNSEVPSRQEWEFTGLVQVSDVAHRTRFAIGAALDKTRYTEDATVEVNTHGEFDITEAATATLDDGTSAGDRMAVSITDSSSDDLTLDGNIENGYGSLELGSSGLRRVNFVWVVPGGEDAPRWSVESTVVLAGGGGGGGSSTPPLVPTDEKTTNYTAQPGELAVFYVASGSRDCLFAPGVNAGDQIGAVVVPGSGGEVLIDTSPTLIGPVPPHNTSGSSGTVYGSVWTWDAINSAWVLMSTINVPLS